MSEEAKLRAQTNLTLWYPTAFYLDITYGIYTSRYSTTAVVLSAKVVGGVVVVEAVGSGSRGGLVDGADVLNAAQPVYSRSGRRDSAPQESNSPSALRGESYRASAREKALRPIQTPWPPASRAARIADGKPWERGGGCLLSASGRVQVRLQEEVAAVLPIARLRLSKISVACPAPRGRRHRVRKLGMVFRRFAFLLLVLPPGLVLALQPLVFQHIGNPADIIDERRRAARLRRSRFGCHDRLQASVVFSVLMARPLDTRGMRLFVRGAMDAPDMLCDGPAKGVQRHEQEFESACCARQQGGLGT
ncbi:hypothetical protein FIBSPDRAFT_933373 [Athelia psychrophila]|uniref:Uncharacterized protein n=1 Tax=Athelia psychrophila TaxID=1759441 RepID=A0A166H919_9AGAM|nr:hypothetical protein FIBSPDRAFT_933373 [Fibularhizoctonia sp. CBS 109695]